MAWYGGWLQGNFAAYHAKDGSGYRLATHVIRDCAQLNTATACRLLRPLLAWQHYDMHRAGAMIKQLHELKDACPAAAIQEQITAGLKNTAK